MESDKLMRDAKTGALLNVNYEGLKGYRAARQQRKRLETLETEILQVRDELKAIQLLLSRCTQRG